MKALIALVDDHVLLRSGLSTLLKDFGYTVAFEAGNGAQLMEKLKTHPLPHLVLMDINMPVMDGLQTTLWLKQHHPQVKVLALSMLEDEGMIIKMIRNGARGYVLKDCEPEELDAAIQSVLQKDFYHSELISQKLMHGLANGNGEESNAPPKPVLNEKELEFLRWCCTELSNKEIAEKMKVSPRTIDSYRDSLQVKLEVKSRIGLTLYALRHGLVTLS